ncbi:MAG TPA: hypothetical protein VGL42_05290 [Opitutaceae bacterium]
MRRLNLVAQELDSARITVGAVDCDKFGNPTNAVPDALAYNEYPGSPANASTPPIPPPGYSAPNSG